MRSGDELVDTGFIFVEEGVDFFLVEDAGALCLGENKVEEEEKAKIAVEWNPIESCGVS